jgi:hypothetical protein
VDGMLCGKGGCGFLLLICIADLKGQNQEI